MGTEVAFDTMNGIDLKGWWSNPSTGESYEVVDQFFQDNSLYVKTRQGQLINFNRIQNFVHSDEPLAKPVEYTETSIGNSNLLEGLDIDTQTDLQNEMDDILRKPVKSKSGSQNPVQQVSVEDKILEKAFSKAPTPDITVAVDWNWKNLDNTMTMLVSTMDLDPDTIADYVCKKFIGDISASLREQIRRIVVDRTTECE